MRIVIPGGSGQVGHILARHFHAKGDEVTVLSRSPAPAPWQTAAWDGVHEGDWIDTLEDSDVCINLAGRSVNCRYNDANRRAIMDSRADSTRILGRVISVACEATRGLAQRQHRNDLSPRTGARERRDRRRPRWR
jgi:NAD dependent epimerase/dehydratase family enzyme